MLIVIYSDYAYIKAYISCEEQNILQGITNPFTITENSQ